MREDFLLIAEGGETRDGVKIIFSSASMIILMRFVALFSKAALKVTPGFAGIPTI